MRSKVQQHQPGGELLMPSRAYLWANPLLLLGLALCLGCGGYGEVSLETYEYAKALYSITNRQSTEGLDKAEEMILAARDAQELPATESGWLLAIVSDAREGDWEGANQEARRLMTDQVD